MMRFINIAMVAMLFASAIAVYSIKYESTIKVERIAKIKRAIEREEVRIEALRAEYAALSAPVRLSELAAAHLDLKPMSIGQVIALDALPEKPETGDAIAEKLEGLGLAVDPVVTGTTP